MTSQLVIFRAFLFIFFVPNPPPPPPPPTPDLKKNSCTNKIIKKSGLSHYLNMHTRLPSGARTKIWLLEPSCWFSFVYASNEGSGEAVPWYRLVGVLVACNYYVISTKLDIPVVH